MDNNTKLRLELLQVCMESCIKDQKKTRAKTNDKELYTYCDGMIQGFEIAVRMINKCMIIEDLDSIMFARTCHNM